VVRLACERPDPLGRRWSQGDGSALARQLIAEGSVADISAATVRRILAAHPLKPWRQHVWLYPKPPWDAACDATVSALIALSPRPRRDDELGRSRDEKTSLPPRPRHSPTQPAPPRNIPHRSAPESKRAGALNLVAAFDTHAGKVYGHCDDRKRPRASIAFWETVAREMDERVRTIHLVCDHVSPHQGQDVQQWWAHHPRLVMHGTPVHGSWMHQVEPWFSILQRQRWRIVDCASKDDLEAKIRPFIHEWNHQAQPCTWSTKSVAKGMAAAPALAAW
jgi:hypothetical protein